jgi:hypothetical protein
MSELRKFRERVECGPHERSTPHYFNVYSFKNKLKHF